MIKKKNTLTGKILLGLFLGFIFGLFLKQMPTNYIKDTVILGGVLKVLGNGFTAAINVKVGTITSLFFSTPDNKSAKCSPAVPLWHATAKFIFKYL